MITQRGALGAVAGILLLGCALLVGADSDDLYSAWSAPVNLGSPVNGGFSEQGASLSRDGLSLYFHAINRPGGMGGSDIWVSHRATTNDPWGLPVNPGPAINSAFDEQNPELTSDGHQLFFSSNRPGGVGGQDLYVARRHDQRDDLAWQPALNLGSGVNSTGNETGPTRFEDDATGAITLFFQSNRPGGQGGADIYRATLQPDETFDAAVPVTELNGPTQDAQPCIRRDGLEIFYNRGTLSDLDLWVATRSSTSAPWSAPEHPGFVLNSLGSSDASPALSFDGTQLFFSSTRQGGVPPCSVSATNPCVFQLWVATRARLTDVPPEHAGAR